jgi:glycine/sarcosine/betaine reductase complex component A
VVVLLGMPTPESAELYALTVTQGDPAWAGALAGSSLGLSVYHIMEPAIQQLVPPDIYQREVSLAELVLDGPALTAAVRQVRDRRRSTSVERC